MILVGACVSDGRQFESVARPLLTSVLQAADEVILDDGSRKICAAYNRFLDRAQNLADCEALVLLHDDVEIHDPNFRAKVHHSTAAGLSRLLSRVGSDVVEERELTTRVDDTTQTWMHRRNSRLRDGIVAPPLDLLRVAAQKPVGFGQTE